MPNRADQPDYRHPYNQFFKNNGELKIDNDLLDDEITRPIDLAFEKTVATQTKETNAILSNRMHAFKTQYYRLDIVLGRVNFSSLNKNLIEEDRLSIRLRELFKRYETQVSLAMIPFYNDRKEHIEKQLGIYRGRNSMGDDEHFPRQTLTQSEQNFLNATLDEVKKALKEEERKVKTIATEMYKTW